jgi:hypothetical protein
MNRLSADRQGVVYRKTFFTGADIDQSNYDIGTFPIICPGQEIEAWVYAAIGDGVTARLFVREYFSQEIYWGDEVTLERGQLARLAHEIVAPDVGLIDRVGIAFSAPQEMAAVVYLDRVHWSGEPRYRLDLDHPDAMTGWSYLRGRWFARAGALNGSHYGRDAEAYTGICTARDYRCQVRLRPHCGERHRILFRVRGAQRSYAFSLAPGGRVAFEKNWQGYREVASAPFDWDLYQAYTLEVEVVGDRMTGFVDGEPLLEWRDPERPWQAGCVGIGVKDGRTLVSSLSLQPAQDAT